MLEKTDILLIGNEFYQVVEDKSENKSPLDYVIQHMDNEHDEMVVSNQQVKANLGHNWKKVDISGYEG